MKKLNSHETSTEVPLYNKEILSLAEKHAKGKRLAKYDICTQEIGALCGSRIIMEVLWEKNSSPKKVAEIGYQIDACALGTASAGIFSEAAIGKTQQETQELLVQVKKMLKGEPFCFIAIQDWQKYSLLQAAQFHKSRHDAILLPVKALLNAFIGENNEPV